jgi:hypothetical protein
MPNTGIVLPTNSDVLPSAVSRYSSSPRSASTKSPSAKSEPVRGTKLTLARRIARSGQLEARAEVDLVQDEPAAPSELTLS